MTDAPRTIQLAPADWRQLVLLNVEQLHVYISSIPANTEAGTSALMPEHIAVVQSHLGKGAMLMEGWRKSRVAGMVPEQPSETKQTANGQHEPTKRKGGWQKGRKRGPRKPQPEATQ